MSRSVAFLVAAAGTIEASALKVMTVTVLRKPNGVTLINQSS